VRAICEAPAFFERNSLASDRQLTKNFGSHSFGMAERLEWEMNHPAHVGDSMLNGRSCVREVSRNPGAFDRPIRAIESRDERRQPFLVGHVSPRKNSV
jgi:hypothetical protein